MKRALTVAAVSLGLLSITTAAFAAWTAQGTGAGTAASDAMPTGTPAAPTASVSGTVVTLTFGAVNTVSGAKPATSYTISRYATAGATTPTATVACTPATLTVPSCTDSPGAGTTTFYTYTPKWGANWNGVQSDKSTGATTAATFTVTSVSPAARGQNSASTTLTVNGTGFVSGNSTISISGSNVTVVGTTFVSSTQLTATVSVAANAAAGARNVTVTKASPTATATCSGCFTVTAAPTVTSASPSTLPRNGTETAVTVTGTGFVTGFVPTLITGSGNFQVISSSFTSSTQVTVTIKNNNTGSSNDKADLTITNPDGGRGTKANAIQN